METHMTTVNAYAATEASGKLLPFTYELGELGANQVDIKVESCGVCHSDLSMLNNEWGMTTYPFVPGHEIVGTIIAKGSGVSHLEIGQRVGVGWHAGSCMHCHQCMSGNHNLCQAAEQTIVGRHGGFADITRASGAWAIPIPESVDPISAGPLFCGGITVFNPLIQLGIKPTDRVGVIGIGGLGHMAVMFLSKWGCEVTAFTSTDSKAEEAKAMGANRTVNSRSDEALAAEAGRFNLILSTVNVSLNWDAYINALAPKGKLHNVGAVLEPIPVGAFSLIMAQRSISGSPVGSVATIADMLEFCGRHQIRPIVETFPMSKVNQALEHLHSGKARYRIVLTAD
jgi:alcohol/geraniol dehydrogenase (NADP+)